jgi:multidrug efflux pump subunit AcrA (membrane-fusion protein)
MMSATGPAPESVSSPTPEPDDHSTDLPEDGAVAATFDEAVTRRVDALFGEGTATEVAGRRRRRRTRKVVVAGVVVTALLASAVWASLASGDSPGDYRTAEAGIHDVAQELTGVATIEPVSQAAVAFPVSGTVATVDVAVGDTVDVGQQLGTLDTQTLTDTLHEKEAALAQAELALSRALAGESTTGTVSGNGGSATSMGSAVAGGGLSTAVLAAISTQAPAGGGSSDQLAAARQAVVDAQAAVDDALAASQAAMDSAASVCAAVGGSTTSTTATPSGTDLAACRTAIEAVQSAQQAVSDAQTALAAASTTLDDQLAAMAEATTGTTTDPTGSTTPNGDVGAPSGSTGSPTGDASTGAGSSEDAVSSEDLIAAQRAVDAAALEVAAAQQAVAQAMIVSPIAGTVVSVGLTVGESVEAGSDTQQVIVQGSGGYEAVTTVGVDDVTSIRVGQAAVVVPDGSTAAASDRTAIEGTVVAISSTPDPDSSTTSYRVTIGFTNPQVALGNGSTGTVTITTDGAVSVLSVPTSAVTTDGDRSTVTVFDGSSTDEVTVQVGAVGEEWTQITGGVEEGERVVLADVDAALPSAATASGSDGSRGGGSDEIRFPGGGQLPAGGQFPGGFTRPGG